MEDCDSDDDDCNVTKKPTSPADDVIAVALHPTDPRSLEQFVLGVPSSTEILRCRITRQRQGIDGRLFPTYYFHLEINDKERVSTSHQHCFLPNFYSNCSTLNFNVEMNFCVNAVCILDSTSLGI